MQTRSRTILAVVGTALLTTLGFIAGRSLRPRSGQEDHTPNNMQDPANKSPTMAPVVASKNFFELRREYDELRKTPAGVQWDFIEKAEAYAKKTKVKSGGPDFSSSFRQSCRKQKV